MTQWHEVARLEDLRARKKLLVTVGDTPIALFCVKDVVYALNDICIHEQRQLSKGAILFGKVVCPGHQWKFDPATGEPEEQEGCQPTYPVQIVDGVVSVALEPAVVLS